MKIQENNEGKLIMNSRAMHEVYCTMKRYAEYADTILLTGETGVGKDLIAKEIHSLSKRKNNSFRRVPLTAINDSLFESELFGHDKGAFTGAERTKIGIIEASNGGTLYFPEISEIPERIQLKLLDFIQYRSYNRVGQDGQDRCMIADVCIIFASNEDLKKYKHNRKIRSDFFYRINKNNIYIPPLRERREDIEVISEYFLRLHGHKLFKKEIRLSRSAINILEEYIWPGNVRELENIIHNILINLASNHQDNDNDIVIRHDHVTPVLHTNNNDTRHLLENYTSRNLILFNTGNQDLPKYETAKIDFKKSYFIELLKFSNGDLRRAASIAELTERGIRKIIKNLDIETTHFQPKIPRNKYSP